MSKEHTLLFTRREVEWLYRKVLGARNHAREIIEAAKSNPPVSDAAKQALAQAENHISMLATQVEEIEKLIRKGMTSLGALTARKAELQEALQLTDEGPAKSRIQEQLDALEDEEEYRVTMNRQSIKYVLGIVENAISRIKTVTIPEYEARPAEHFENSERPRSRSYYINKQWRDKTMLEDIQKRLEKRL